MTCRTPTREEVENGIAPPSWPGDRSPLSDDFAFAFDSPPPPVVEQPSKKQVEVDDDVEFADLQEEAKEKEKPSTLTNDEKLKILTAADKEEEQEIGAEINEWQALFTPMRQPSDDGRLPENIMQSPPRKPVEQEDEACIEVDIINYPAADDVDTSNPIDAPPSAKEMTAEEDAIEDSPAPKRARVRHHSIGLHSTSPPSVTPPKRRSHTPRQRKDFFPIIDKRGSAFSKFSYFVGERLRVQITGFVDPPALTTTDGQLRLTVVECREDIAPLEQTIDTVDKLCAKKANQRACIEIEDVEACDHLKMGVAVFVDGRWYRGLFDKASFNPQSRQGHVHLVDNGDAIVCSLSELRHISKKASTADIWSMPIAINTCEFNAAQLRGIARGAQLTVVPLRRMNDGITWMCRFVRP